MNLDTKQVKDGRQVTKVNQKRYNLMIVGEEAVNKLESLPERHKGVYVSQAIIDKVKMEQEELNISKRYIMPAQMREGETFETYMRRIISEEIAKIMVVQTRSSSF